MKKTIAILSGTAALSSVVSACAGIFYTDAGARRTVENIYGQAVTLYGDGVYAENSLLKTGAAKGTDAVILFVGLLLAVLLVHPGKKKARLFQTGLLAIILYASVCLVMGVSFNRCFLLYVLQFGSSLFAFLLSLKNIAESEVYGEKIYGKHLIGTGVFLIVGGCSALVWLMFILPAAVTGRPMETIEIYTTEPAFAIDLGVVLPAAAACGVMLLRKKKAGYKLAPVLLTFLTGVGACVISQTMFQASLGIFLPPGRMIGLVVSFVILGAVAALLNFRLLQYAE